MSDRIDYDLRDKEALILCGGLGTRLREETEFKPKPMVEIGGRPILWHIMKIYAAFGVRKFVLCLGYRGEVIREYIRNYALNNSSFKVELSSNRITALGKTPVEDWEVSLVETGAETMTGGRILRALEYIEGDNFFATYGDGVADIDIAALYHSHQASKAKSTLTVVHPSSRFGEVQETEGFVTGFAEKPQTTEGWINGGFFVFEKSAFSGFEVLDKSVLEADILPVLARNNHLGVYKHKGFWQCMDTFRETQILNKLCADGVPPWLTMEGVAAEASLKG